MRELIFRSLFVLLIFSLGKVNIKAEGIIPSRLTHIAIKKEHKNDIKKEHTKIIKKEFDISSDGKVSISNRHGEVNINTWEKEQVKIEITITVDERSEDKAREMFERINVDFSNGKNHVQAKTEIESKSSSWWWGSSENNNNDYTIDYEVYMPKSNSLDLENKYGNAYVASLDNEAMVQIKYGNLRMEEIGGRLDLTLGYGNGTVVKSKDADVKVSYGNIRIKNADDVIMESKYSKVYIDHAGDINSTSKYDTYELGDIKDFKNQGKYDHIEIVSAESIRASAKYSDFKVERIIHSADFDLAYGNVVVESLAKNFTEVQLLGRYTQFKIHVQDGANYKLDAVTKYAGVGYPDKMDVVYEKEKGSSVEVEGYMGGNKNTVQVIKARLDYGGIKVREE